MLFMDLGFVCHHKPEIIMKPPVTVQLTEKAVMSKELSSHTSVCLSITNYKCITLNTF